MESTGSRVISTKVSEDAYQRLKNAAMKMGLKTTYDLLQTTIDCLLRFIDRPDDASQELREFMGMVFGNFDLLAKRSNISSAKGSENSLQLGKAILFLHEKGKSPEQNFAVMIDGHSFFGEVNATYNVQDIFEKLMKTCFPHQYGQLQDIMRGIDSSSMIEALTYLLNKESGMNEAEASILALFGDNDRVGFGQHMAAYDKKYKSRHHIDIDGKRFDLQEVDLFDKVENDSE